MRKLTGVTLSCDSETIDGYVGVWGTVNEESHPKYGEIIRILHHTRDNPIITGNDKNRLLRSLQKADVSVWHNRAYDLAILYYIVTKVGEVHIDDVKKHNDYIFNGMNKFQRMHYEKNAIKYFRETMGINTICTLEILSGGGKGAFIGLKTLQNGFGLKVDKQDDWENVKLNQEFLDYFTNDVISLRDIWKKHWAFEGTFVNRRNSLELLDKQYDKFLLYGGLSNYLNTILGKERPHRDNTKFINYEVIDVNAPEFQEHRANIWQNLEDIKRHWKDGNAKAKFMAGLKRTVDYKENDVDYSMGGIHSVHRTKRLFRADEEYGIYHIDVESLYPSIMIRHKEKFQHMEIEMYEDIKYKRVEYKKAKRMVESDAFKLILNSSYGIVNMTAEQGVSFKEAGMFICLEGHRLLLSMLDDLDAFMEYELIQLNTDGVYIRAKKSDVPVMNMAIDIWEKREVMKMDVESFDWIYQADVNNYLALEDNGHLHRKGKFAINFRSYSNTACPVTVREMCVSMLKGEEFTAEPVGIFNPKDAKNYYLTTPIKGHNHTFTTPSGNPSSLGGVKDYNLTTDPKLADMSEYKRIAEYILEPERLKAKEETEKYYGRIEKLHQKYYDAIDKARVVENAQGRANKVHKEMGYEYFTKTSWRNYINSK